MLLRFVCCCIFFVAACGTPDHFEAHRAEPIVDVSSHKSPEEMFTADHATVILQKHALRKLFLLTSSIIVANNTPAVDYLLPKIVQFEANDDEVALLEVNSVAIYANLPSTKLLQTFKIIAQTNDTISFQWLHGLRQVSMKPAWVISDFPGSVRDVLDSEEHVLPTVDSFVRSVNIVHNGLELQQISRVKSSRLSIDLFGLLASQGVALSEMDYSIQIHSRLVPYEHHATFHPKTSALEQGVGYFEIAHIEKGNATVHMRAARWDLSNDDMLVYRISKDVPEALVDAFKEGILYWNMVAQRPIIRVETHAETTLYQPREREVMVHWVDFSNSGLAQAALQPDPITGEILNADIYFASGWDHAVQKLASQKIVTNGFQSANVCHYHQGIQNLRQVLQTSHVKRNTSNFLKVRQDYIRFIIAHEVGHTLGLRHNFAGNVLSALESDAALQEAMQAYMLDVSHPGVATSSTVMDYLSVKDTLLLGAYIKNHALPYDTMAFAWGYGDLSLHHVHDLEIPFCTDMDALMGSALIGCDMHDSGRNPVDGDIGMLHNHILIAQELLDDVVDKLALSPIDLPHSVQAILNTLNPAFVLYEHTAVIGRLFDVMRSDAEALDVRLRMGQQSLVNYTAYQHESQRVLVDYVESAGGLPAIVRAMYPNKDHTYAPDAGWIKRDMQKLLNDDNFGHGISISGVAYNLLADTILQLKEHMPHIAAHAEQLYMQHILHVMGNLETAPYHPSVIDDSWEVILGDIATHVILDASSINTALDMVVPKASYPLSARLSAIDLFDEKLFHQPGWLQALQNQLAEHIEQRQHEIQKVLDILPKDRVLRMQRIDIQKLYDDESAILARLNKKSTMSYFLDNLFGD